MGFRCDEAALAVGAMMEDAEEADEYARAAAGTIFDVDPK